MRYRVYNEKNWSERLGFYLATYFRTKKDAIEFAKQLDGNVRIERKLVDTWVAC